MNLLERIHEGYVFGRRVRALARHCAAVIPENARVLDVGCGDGLLARLILQQRPDITLTGIDVLVRDRTHIPVTPFDGQVIPFPDDSFDVVVFIDVLHHTDDPMVLLRQAARVAASGAARGDQVATVVQEIGAGGTEARPKLLAVRADLSSGGIVVEHTDRLTRWGLHSGQTLLTTQRRVTAIVTQAENGTQDVLADLSALVSAVGARRSGPRRATRTTAALVRA